MPPNLAPRFRAATVEYRPPCLRAALPGIEPSPATPTLYRPPGTLAAKHEDARPGVMQSVHTSLTLRIHFFHVAVSVSISICAPPPTTPPPRGVARFRSSYGDETWVALGPCDRKYYLVSFESFKQLVPMLARWQQKNEAVRPGIIYKFPCGLIWRIANWRSIVVHSDLLQKIPCLCCHLFSQSRRHRSDLEHANMPKVATKRQQSFMQRDNNLILTRRDINWKGIFAVQP